VIPKILIMTSIHQYSTLYSQVHKIKHIVMQSNIYIKQHILKLKWLFRFKCIHIMIILKKSGKKNVMIPGETYPV